MPLSFVKAGERVRIAAINSGNGFRSKLAALGMVPGAEIDVLCNTRRGSFIIAIKGSRIMLGRGMAQRIIVS